MLFDTYYLLAVDPNDGSTMIHLLRDDWSEECTVGAILLALQASIALHAIFMMQSTMLRGHSISLSYVLYKYSNIRHVPMMLRNHV